MSNTKPGTKKENYDDESSAKVLKTAKTLVRTDWGGHDALEVIRKKAADKGIELGPMTLEFIKTMVEEHVASVRKRIFPRIDAVIVRIDETKTPLETAP